MAKKEKTKGWLEQLWELMDSMKFAVVLLILMTTVSVVGVLLPQYVPDSFSGTLEMLYLDKFGNLLGSLFLFLGLDHLFTVWWYYLLLALLCFNILVCSFNRIGNIFRLSRRVHFLKEEQKLRDQTHNRTLNLNLAPERAAAEAAGVLKSEGYRVYESAGDNEGERLVFAKRGYLSPFGPFFTHIAVVLVILGAAVSYLMSFEHFQWMAEGETIRVPEMSYLTSPGYQVQMLESRLGAAFGMGEGNSGLLATDHLVRSSDWRELPADIKLGTVFRVRLDRFEAQFTTSGKPKAYLSTVTVLDGAAGGEPLFSHVIKVNDPLIYKGVYFYQSSYSPGGGGAEWVDLTVTSNDSSSGTPASYTLKLKPGSEAAPLGDSGDSIRVDRFVGTFKMNQQGQVTGSSGEDRNPAAEVSISSAGEPEAKSWVFKNFPNFSHRPGQTWSVVLEDYQKGYITGLTIRTHRSQDIIWLGFTLLVLGVMLSFYLNHREFWVLVKPGANGGSRVVTAGLSYKWKQPFIHEFDRIVSRISAPSAADGAPQGPAGGSKTK